MKKILVCIICLLGPLSCWAQNNRTPELQVVDGIKYYANQNKHVATVFKVGPNAPSKVVIPNEVSLFNVSCRVVAIADECFYTPPDEFLTNISTVKEIVLPNSIKTIGKYAFEKCVNLESITFPEYMQDNDFINPAIEYGAFRNCTKLKEIKIPNGITRLPGSVFRGCTSLEKVILPNTIESVGGFEGCTSLRFIDLPESVRRVGDFDDCINLQGMKFPPSVEDIGRYRRCTSLTKIEIPSKVKKIAWEAFLKCKNLTTVISRPEIPPTLGEDAFSGIGKKATLYVPYSAINRYMKSPWKKSFKNILPISQLSE